MGQWSAMSHNLHILAHRPQMVEQIERDKQRKGIWEMCYRNIPFGDTEHGDLIMSVNDLKIIVF